MAIGSSGRIVIEVEPELKQLLYSALQKEGMTLKDWFLDNTRRFLYEDKQLALDFSGGVDAEPVPKSTDGGKAR